MRQSIVISALMFGWASFVNAQGASDSAPAPTTAPSGKICIAIIAPEVSADLPVQQREAIAGAVDTLLTEAISAQKGFVLVDRLALDKVLDEHKISVGAGKLTADQVAQPLRPFWSAGVLICTRLDVKAKVLIVEAVSAQTGQLIANLYVSDNLASADGVAKAMGPKLPAFEESIARGVARIQDKPLLEVSGKLTGALTRLTWMVDDLSDAAGAKAAAGGKVAWLVPRQPLVTKEERLLRVMGLAQATKGDAAAGLSPVPQIRLTFDLIDSAKTGVAFEKMPISLKLSLHRGLDKPMETQIDGEVGQWDACRDKAVAWLNTQLAAMSGDAGPVTGDQQEHARQLAKDEVDAIAALTPLGGSLRDLDQRLRLQLFHHATRAANLDPTNEMAAFLIATNVKSLYDKSNEMAGYDRAIMEGRRYLDRFDNKVPDHRRKVMHMLSSDGLIAIFTLRKDRSRHSEPLSFAPDERVYSYARYCVRVMAEYGCLGRLDEQYNDSNDFDIFGYHLVGSLVPNCPADMLDEEYSWWKEFYRTKFAKALTSKRPRSVTGSEPPAPWQLVEAAFAVRRKDVPAVRTAFVEMAKTYPQSLTRLWGGDQYREAIIPAYLKAAGDKEWKTWRPDFSKARKEEVISFDEMTAFVDSLLPRFPSAAPAGPDPKAPGVAFIVPDEVRKAEGNHGSGRLRTGEVLLLVDDEAWLNIPGPWTGGSPMNRRPSMLYRAKMPDVIGKDISLSPVALPWPERPAGSPLNEAGKSRVFCYYVQTAKAGSTVWLGTDQGLARFDHAKDGTWKSRWYTMRDGFPCDYILSISMARKGQTDVLLIVGWPDSSGQNRHVFTLDPVSNRCTAIFDGTRKDLRLAYGPTARLRDGRVVLVNLFSKAYGNVNLDDIVEFTTAGTYGEVAAVVDAATGKASIWEGEWDGPARVNHLRELSGTTAKPVFEAFRSERIAVFPFEEIRGFFTGAEFLNDPMVALSVTPYFYTTYAVGVGDTLWLAGAPIANAGLTMQIFGYRPAGNPKQTPTAASAPASGQAAGSGEMWIGPFAAPDGTLITNMVSAGNGKLLVTTRQATYLVTCSDMVAAAERTKRVWRPDGSNSQAQERLAAADWQAQVPAMILHQQWDKALELLDQRQKAIEGGAAGNQERVRLSLWRAHLLARMPGQLDKSIELYRTIARTPANARCARLFAAMNEVFLLHKAGRYADMLALIDQVSREFPQVNPERSHSPVNWYITDARKKLAAQSQPTTRPAERVGG